MTFKAWFPYSRYQSLSVVDGLSRSLEFLSLWESLPVVGGFSGSLTVFQRRVAEINFESIPATQSLAVFEGRYLSLQKFHSCFHIVVQD